MHSNTSSQHIEAACTSTDRGMDKEDVIHVYNGTTARKKNEIIPSAATWMDRETVILSEGSQTEKEKYHMATLICGI